MHSLRDEYAKQQNGEFMTSSIKENMKTSEERNHLLSNAKYDTVKKETNNTKIRNET